MQAGSGLHRDQTVYHDYTDQSSPEECVAVNVPSATPLFNLCMFSCRHRAAFACRRALGKLCNLGGMQGFGRAASL